MLNKSGEAYRLFNLENDPHEMHDLVEEKEHKHLIAELREKLLNRRAQTEKS